MYAPTSLWIVLDAEGRPEFAAGWREAAHEHIKDAIEIEVDETASRWVVREYVPVAERDSLRAEVEALKLQGAAAELVHRETATTVLVQMAEVEALRAERQVLNSAIVAAKSETAEFAEVAINAQNEVEALKAGNYKLTDVLLRNGFRRCHNIFCNCGSWHYEGGYRARMDEITEALAEAGYPLSNENGNTPLRALGELVAEVEALRADAERYRWLRNKAGRGAAGSIFDNFNGSAVDECIDAARAAQGDKP